MTFNKCSINGVVYGDQNEINYGESEDMIKVPQTYRRSFIYMYIILTHVTVVRVRISGHFHRSIDLYRFSLIVHDYYYNNNNPESIVVVQVFTNEMWNINTWW